jgi:hypothetical protein
MAIPPSSVFLETCTELLRQGHRVRFRAGGPSMEPTIHNGEAILVEPVPASGLRRGDIALYRTARGAIAHRVVGFPAADRESVCMRGDAPGASGEIVARQQILGRVVAVERNRRILTLRRMGFYRTARCLMANWRQRILKLSAVKETGGMGRRAPYEASQ